MTERALDVNSSHSPEDIIEGPCLRIGILIESSIQPRWVRRVLEEIQVSDIARVVLVLRRVAGAQMSRSRWMTVARDGRHWLTHFYLKLDDLLFRPTNNA